MNARHVNRYGLLIAGAIGIWSIAAAPPALAQKSGADRSHGASAKERHTGLGDFGSNKDPIKIDSDRLDVFDRDGKAVFTGNVVAVQGDSTMRCTSLTVFYEQTRGSSRGKPGQAQAEKTQPDATETVAAEHSGEAQGAAAAKSAGVGGLSNGESSIKKIDCKGPVTIVSKTQVATGDNAEFDKTANRVYLTGNAALSDGPNVTRGERVVYDLNTGIANVEGGRVRALIVPGSQNKGSGQKSR